MADKPGDGTQKVTAMANVYVPAPAGPDKSSWWAGLNDRPGVDMKMTPRRQQARAVAPRIRGLRLSHRASDQRVAKTDDKEKIKLLLRVSNWLASPFGTQVQYDKSFGVEGIDHELVNGEPVLTDRGVADIALPVGYRADAPHALHQPGRPQDIDVEHAYMAKVLPLSEVDPTVGLFSNSAVTKSATANTTLGDTVNDHPGPQADRRARHGGQDVEAGRRRRDEYVAQLQAKGGPDSKPS